MAITTRLIGAGVFTDGKMVAWPVNPWVVYDGEYTRPCPKRFRIIDNQLYELDGVTQASLPPSYIDNGEEGPIVFPNDNYYGFEIFQKGKRSLKGFIRVPYDPLDQGVQWYDMKLTPQKPTYPTALYASQAFKIYATPAARDADTVLAGVIAYVQEDLGFYGYNGSVWRPFYANAGVGFISDIIHLGDTVSETVDQVVTEPGVATDGIRIGDSVSGTNLLGESRMEIILFGDATVANEAAVPNGVAQDRILFGESLQAETPLASGVITDVLIFSENMHTLTVQVFPAEGIEYSDQTSSVLAGFSNQGSVSDTILFGISDISTRATYLFETEKILYGDEASYGDSNLTGTVADTMVMGETVTAIVNLTNSVGDTLIFSEDMTTAIEEPFPGEGLTFTDTTDSVII